MGRLISEIMSNSGSAGNRFGGAFRRGGYRLGNISCAVSLREMARGSAGRWSDATACIQRRTLGTRGTKLAAWYDANHMTHMRREQHVAAYRLQLR